MSAVVQKGRRNTQSGAVPPPTASPYHHENPHDVSSEAYAQDSTDYSAHPTTPPRTPRRDGKPHSQSKPNSTAPETGSKQKPRNNNKKAKNVMTSPAVTRNGRNTSPFTGARSAGMA